MTSRRNTSSQGGDTKAGIIRVDVVINKYYYNNYYYY